MYTTNLIDNQESIVFHNLIDTLVYHYPNALTSHRSIKEMLSIVIGIFF